MGALASAEQRGSTRPTKSEHLQGGLPRLVLVDGNNVMGSRPDGWWRDRRRAMQRLVDEVAAHAARSDGEWMIVFDGRPRSLTAPPDDSLNIVYSERRGKNAADDRIVEIAADSTPHRSVLVYTSDRDLRSRVTIFGAEVKGAGALRRML